MTSVSFLKPRKCVLLSWIRLSAGNSSIAAMNDIIPLIITYLKYSLESELVTDEEWYQFLLKLQQKNLKKLANKFELLNQSNLLYKGTRDGFDAVDFHKHCDKKGPTLILVKLVNDVICGGYSSISWKSASDSRYRGNYVHDPFAILFQIKPIPNIFFNKNENGIKGYNARYYRQSTTLLEFCVCCY